MAGVSGVSGLTTCASQTFSNSVRGGFMESVAISGGSHLLAGLAARRGAGLERDAVDDVEVGAGAPLDDVGRQRTPAVVAGGVLDLERHLALRVLARGDAGDLVVPELHGDAGDLLDRLEDGVDRPV